jgi:hypothetical protein
VLSFLVTTFRGSKLQDFNVRIGFRILPVFGQNDGLIPLFNSLLEQPHGSVLI